MLAGNSPFTGYNKIVQSRYYKTGCARATEFNNLLLLF